MTKKQKRHIIATIGTVLFMLLVFLILWLARMVAMLPEQEEGIEVAFGEVEEAGGYMAEQSEALPLPAPEAAAPEPVSAPSDNDLMTQEDEKQKKHASRPRHRSVSANVRSRLVSRPNARHAKRRKRSAKPKKPKRWRKRIKWVHSSAIQETLPVPATAKGTDRKGILSDTVRWADITGRSKDVA